MRRLLLTAFILMPTVAPALEPQDAASYFSSGAVTPQQAEQYLEEIRSPLIHNSDGDHVNSYYYFGIRNQRTLIGLERVKGDDYSQYFSLLIFDGKELLGYYRNIASLPLFIEENGQLLFPRGIELNEEIFIDQDTFPPLCLNSEPCVAWTPHQTSEQLSDQESERSLKDVSADSGL